MIYVNWDSSLQLRTIWILPNERRSLLYQIFMTSTRKGFINNPVDTVYTSVRSSRVTSSSDLYVVSSM